jgi:ribonuclease-3
MDKRIAKLEEKLDHKFSDMTFIERALTHSSAGMKYNYERLEFLGDRVLGLTMAHLLFKTFPKEREGDMAKRHAALVQGKTLSIVANKIELGELMVFSDAERSAGGAQNANILADGLEGVIGALYLDAGLEKCSDIIEKLWGDLITTMNKPPQDPKTALQEWAQARMLSLPTYELVGKEGPDHAPVFEVKVHVEGYPTWTTTGSSRRKAEKDAAGMLLAHLEEIED